jgi:peptidoglycan/LPS O-acetylase OafA/YrhL
MKLDQLTFTRFIAAISIVFFHFKELAFPFHVAGIHKAISFLDVLVSYFFVLSGFILVISLKDKINVRSFYLKRFSRIYPLYFFALLLSLLLLFNARTPKDTVSLEKVLLSITFLQSWFKSYQLIYNFPSWSLSVEAFFYLLFPFIIFIFKKVLLKWELGIVIGIWLCMQCLYIFMIDSGSHYTTYHPVFHLASFMIGITAGKVFKTNFFALQHHTKLLELSSLTALLLLAYLIKSNNSFFELYYRVGLLSPIFVIIIWTIALSKRRCIQLFKNPRLQYLGEISYGIYILQIPVSVLIFGLIDRTFKFSPSISFCVYLAFLLLFCAFTYELIEKPGKKIIQKLFA